MLDYVQSGQLIFELFITGSAFAKLPSAGLIFAGLPLGQWCQRLGFGDGIAAAICSEKPFFGLLAIAALVAIALGARRARLPQPPLWFPIASVLLWVLISSRNFQGDFKVVNAADELLLTWALLRFIGWLLVELPPAFGLFKPLPSVLQDLFFWGIFSILVVVELQRYGGVDLVGLFATSAVLTAVIGLALQEPLKDFLAGIEIQIDPPFRKGDWIEIGDLTGGVVVDMHLMDTVIKDVDNSILTIPNAQVTDNSVKTFACGEPVGNSFSVSLDYQFPPGQAMQFLSSIVKANPRVLSDPAPIVWLGSYDDFSIRYDIIVYQADVSTAARNGLKSDLLSNIWYALEREGHSFPYPVMQMARWTPGSSANDPAALLTKEKISHLQNAWLFKDLDVKQFESLVANVRFVRFGPGEMIVAEGDEDSILYQVIKGRVEILKMTADREPLRVAVVGEDAILGEMSLLTGEPRAASLCALDECLLLEVERRDLEPILQADPALLESLAQLVAQRRSELENLAAGEATTRELGILDRMRQIFGFGP